MVWLYAGFLFFVFLMLALDLGVFHKQAHIVGIREALVWSAIWIGLAIAFSVFIYFGYEYRWLGLGTTLDVVSGTTNDGRDALLKYLTGYVIEKSLSVDNIFVIATIFSSFAVPPAFQHRVLFWGIIGALAMRGAMIAIGSEVIAHYHWVLYIFGAFLLLTGVKMFFIKEKKDVQESAVVRGISRVLPIDRSPVSGKFVVRKAGKLYLTSLGLALLVVEVSDLIFAVDSIPAIFAITGDPYLVFTSNVFAMLGLRSLYFALAGMLDLFRYLKPALALILVIVGGKMLLAEELKALLGPNMSLWILSVIVFILAASIVASMAFRKKPDALKH